MITLKEFLDTNDMRCKTRIFYKEKHFDLSGDDIEGFIDFTSDHIVVEKWNVQNTTHFEGEGKTRHEVTERMLFVYTKDDAIFFDLTGEGVRRP